MIKTSGLQNMSYCLRFLKMFDYKWLGLCCYLAERRQTWSSYSNIFHGRERSRVNKHTPSMMENNKITITCFVRRYSPDPCIKTSAMFLQLLAMLLQMKFRTFEKRPLLNSGAISKYFILFPIAGQRFLQSVFGFQLHCFDFIFGGVKRPIYYRT